jgi:hypothetical protein
MLLHVALYLSIQLGANSKTVVGGVDVRKPVMVYIYIVAQRDAHVQEG